jgi:hypothetical protein
MIENKPNNLMTYITDLSIFEEGDNNRPIKPKTLAGLRITMKRDGFWPTFPLWCVRLPNHKLRVKGGNHRLIVARELGIGVFCVIYDSPKSVHEAERIGGKWTMPDHFWSLIGQKDADCEAVLNYMNKYGIPLCCAVSLMMGENAGSSNANKAIVGGTYHVATDQSWPLRVGRMMERIVAAGVDFKGGKAQLINSLCRAMRVPEFKDSIFVERIKRAPTKLVQCANDDQYLALFENIYNHGSKGTALPLAFLAREIGKQRQASFGGNLNHGKKEVSA